MLELLRTVAVRTYDVAVTYKSVLIRYETLKSDRTSCVDLGCCDTYFCAKAVTEAVSKSCRAVNENTSGIDHGHEALSSLFILSNYRISVA